MRLKVTRAVGVPLALERQGETLLFNGEPLDLSAVPEGATVEPGGTDCPWINGPIERVAGDLVVPIIGPYSGGVLPDALWSPPDINDPPDGIVDLPAYEVSDVVQG